MQHYNNVYYVCRKFWYNYIDIIDLYWYDMGPFRDQIKV